LGNGAKGMSALPPICVTVMAHNEEGRIATCLRSLPLGDEDVAIHLVVNGSSDRTAAIAREIAAATNNLCVHEYEAGGKSRSWNRFVLKELPEFHSFHVFADGDAEILPGSITALAKALENHLHANAASGFPRNGRRAEHYDQMIRTHNGMFGDLYALRGTFLARMKVAGIRLPDDLIGDDGLIGALAKTDLESETNLDATRVLSCPEARFLCEPVKLWRLSSWSLQYRRMINYSVRYFQNAMITKIMRGSGPAALPASLSSLYPAMLPTLQPRMPFVYNWFDRIALRRMAQSISK
jgi:glycosyltransferase involved in cell wall biosynthesis